MQENTPNSKSLIVDMEIHCPHFDQPDKRCGGADDLPLVASLHIEFGRYTDSSVLHCGIVSLIGMFYVPGGGVLVRPDEPQTAADVHRAVLCPVFAGPRLCYHHPFLVFLRAGAGVFFTINSVLTAAASEVHPSRECRMGAGPRLLRLA